ncbi:hypothetical protein IAE22_32945, partial [Bacillus sp. S34]|nr:hypothetical protein [Bacillus sp. S34]
MATEIATPVAAFASDERKVYGVQWRSWPTPSGEHVDQIAQVMAGYTLGGADMLRRAMGK